MRERGGKWLAYHEAGHAVARLALDLVCEYPGPYTHRLIALPNNRLADGITDRRGNHIGDALGLAEQDSRVNLAVLPVLMASDLWPTVREHTLRQARYDIIECFAGPAAEGIHRKSSKASTMLYHHLLGGTDFTRPAMLAEALGIADHLNLFDEAWRLMRSRWTSVRAVAEALHERLELDGEEVVTLANLR